jgi:pyruvate/2-oxoglutarate dehydrogenase complex dihydrolipoamide acyltransferase (E2) component
MRFSQIPTSTTIRGFVSRTSPLLEKRRMKVPEMGDSIREGTIVEWAVKTGQAVKTDDVVAMVETDKVTVEIRAEIDGVLTEKFAEV